MFDIRCRHAPCLLLYRTHALPLLSGRGRVGIFDKDVHGQCCVLHSYPAHTSDTLVISLCSTPLSPPHRRPRDNSLVRQAYYPFARIFPPPRFSTAFASAGQRTSTTAQRRVCFIFSLPSRLSGYCVFFCLVLLCHNNLRGTSGTIKSISFYSTSPLVSLLLFQICSMMCIAHCAGWGLYYWLGEAATVEDRLYGPTEGAVFIGKVR